VSPNRYFVVQKSTIYLFCLRWYRCAREPPVQAARTLSLHSQLWLTTSLWRSAVVEFDKKNVKHEADKRARSSKWKAFAVYVIYYELCQTVTLSFACPTSIQAEVASRTDTRSLFWIVDASPLACCRCTLRWILMHRQLRKNQQKRCDYRLT
jgi:hypothetical protein